MSCAMTRKRPTLDAKAWASLIVVIFASAPARAEGVANLPCRDADGASQRAAHVAAYLRHEARRAATWRYAWTGINGAFAVGSFAAIPLVDPQARPDFVLGGIGSTLSTVIT